jgi:membrane-associated HD superfamily phosphohydrolase
MLTIALISRWVQRRRVSPINGLLRQEFSAVLTVSFLTVGSLILLSYHDYPDAAYHLPMGIILMILTLLTGYSISSGTFSRYLLLAYGSLAAWRTATLFIHFL